MAYSAGVIEEAEGLIGEMGERDLDKPKKVAEEQRDELLAAKLVSILTSDTNQTDAVIFKKLISKLIKLISPQP